MRPAHTVYADADHYGPHDAAPFPGATWHYARPEVIEASRAGVDPVSLEMEAEAAHAVLAAAGERSERAELIAQLGLTVREASFITIETLRAMARVQS